MTSISAVSFNHDGQILAAGSDVQVGQSSRLDLPYILFFTTREKNSDQKKLW